LYITTLVAYKIHLSRIWEYNYGFVVRGESPGCRLISTASMLEWLINLLPHHSQGSSTERWSRNTLRVVTAIVFYVLWGVLTSPFILNNSVETAAPFNVVTHPRCSEPRNYFDLLRGSNLWPLVPSAGCLTARPPELTIDPCELRFFLNIQIRLISIFSRLTSRISITRCFHL